MYIYIYICCFSFGLPTRVKTQTRRQTCFQQRLLMSSPLLGNDKALFEKQAHSKVKDNYMNRKTRREHVCDFSTHVLAYN